MKSIALAVLVFAAGSAGPAIAQPDDLPMFGWLTGVWETTRDGRVVEERWTAPTNSAMIGMSRTVADGRTAAFEFLRIERRGNEVFYVPQPNGRPPVSFQLVSSADGRFVFAADSGEHRVSRIEYQRTADGVLYARVEGAENGKPFVLEYRYTRRP